MTPNTLPTATRARLDQVGKRILAHLARKLPLDASEVARSVGASEEVVRARLAAMQESGLLRGVDLRVDPAVLGQPYEYLVSGVPTAHTDRQAIERLCASGGVTRVFGLASSHGVAFTLRGSEPAGTQARGLELARDAGLLHTQAVMIVNTFHERTGFGSGDFGDPSC